MLGNDFLNITQKARNILKVNQLDVTEMLKTCSFKGSVMKMTRQATGAAVQGAHVRPAEGSSSQRTPAVF